MCVECFEGDLRPRPVSDAEAASDAARKRAEKYQWLFPIQEDPIAVQPTVSARSPKP